MSSTKSNKRNQSKMLMCTACPKRSDAECLHPILQVPICGACSAALKDADQALIDNQQQSCAWCGSADYVHLLMCDTCPRSFCEDCVERNFGRAEATFVVELSIWSCYACHPTTKLKALQVHEDITYFNIDRAFATVRPPSVNDVRSKSSTLIDQLSPEERKFASIFTNSIKGTSIQDSELIGQYLTALDLSIVLRVSVGLRKLFQSEIFVIPGLFKTEYGMEHQCKLYDHQIVSLNRMTQIENENQDFGALRGGIFGDEPGLGKTVTTLALVATTAGLLPQVPAAFWNKETINQHWQQMRGQYGALLGPVLNTLQKCPAMGRFQLDSLRLMRLSIEQHCATIETFEAAGNV